ncbi:hypothetical protein NDN08_002830 [Rhodosorus marinus]|uniref:Uncharacterized protein n=1 Tax=Rhodosorus marinus TaxID=101924 RepID=A0AAV8UZ43_9RHOD|nr:hypothetical protein NDN08_002830 [Rhodosorus marinus]
MKRPRSTKVDTGTNEGWIPGKRFRSSACLKACKHDPVKAVEWAKDAVERLPNVPIREQRNLAVVLKALEYRFESRILHAAKSKLKNDFSREIYPSRDQHEPPIEEHQRDTDHPNVPNRASSETLAVRAENSHQFLVEKKSLDTSAQLEDTQRDPQSSLVGDELELWKSLDSWGRQNDTMRRLKLPKASLKAFLNSTHLELWASLAESDKSWSDESLALMVDQLLQEEDMCYRVANACMKYSICPRLVALNASATREFMSSTVRLCTSYPRAALETLFPECLDHLSVAIAEVLTRVSREIGKPEFSEAALEQTCRKIWNESAVKLVEGLFTSCKPEGESVKYMISAFDRNSSNLGSSVRFAKLAMLILNRTPADDLRPYRDTLFCALSRCDSFLAKNLTKRMRP